MTLQYDALGPNAQLLLNYWKSVCKGNQLPSWTDIKIGAIASIASRIVVYDIMGKSGARIRYAGEEIALRMQGEITGGVTTNFGKMDEQIRVAEISRGVIMTPCACVSSFYYRGSPVEPVKLGYNFTMPVLNKDGDPRLLLMTDDWVEIVEDESSIPEAKNDGQKKVGYITMCDEYAFVDVGFGLPEE